MNLFKAFKAYLTVKSELKSIKEEYKMESTVKPGWKTSEFWLHVLFIHIPSVLGSLSGVLPAKYAALASVASASLYTLSRLIQKAVADYAAATGTKPAIVVPTQTDGA